jgi:UDP-4-amino-4,6-dideoxy-N-acetyl-beta-L-altrosamine N-acetyltransferase
MMLTGKLVYLAPLRDEDLPLLFAWINDRDTALWNAPYHPVSESDHRVWAGAVAAAANRTFFVVKRKGDDRTVGACQLHSIHPVHRSAELQIRIGEAADRGHGFGSEALQLLLKFAFEDLNLHRVQLQVFASNAAALRVYERAGFVREGTLRQAAHIDGQYVDVVVMGILREDHARS